MEKRIYLYIILLAFVAPTDIFSQDYAKELEQAAGYHKSYNFSKAVEIYHSILAARPDSTLKSEADSSFNADIYTRLVMSENGRNLLKYAYIPHPVTKKKSNTSSFYLNYPGFGKNTWMNPPEQYVEGGKEENFNVMNLQKDARVMVFSAKDKSGAWNIMHSTRLNDTLWSAPQIANENITTSGDEILPHLSPCGKKLYFASNGHSGMGGFDLYISEWNEETGDWGTAQNLGFPFSSTANDYMYYETPCGNFTLFTSDREGDENMVTTYVVRHEVSPLKMEIGQKDAPKYAKLDYTLPDNPSVSENPAKEANDGAADPRYAEAADLVNKTQEKLQMTIEVLDSRRARYSATQDSLKRVAMEPDMLLLEKEVLSLTAKLGEQMNNLQIIELELLAKGITVKYPSKQNTPLPAQENTLPKFAFAQNTMGKTPGFTFEVIEPELDLSFKIGSEAFVADLSEIPDGLVYHIQLMTTTRKASIKALKGFSPVFERKLPSGKYTYSVGVFRKYAEALKNLNTVRRNGFPTALITAYDKGKSISTKNARILEKQDNSMYRVTIGGYDILPQEALAAIRENTTRDIAKANINGVMKYVVGPFTDKAQAEKLMNALLSRQVTNVEIEKLENK